MALVAALALATSIAALALEFRSVERRVQALERASTAAAPQARAEPPAPPTAATWTCSGAVPDSALAPFMASHGRDVFACAEQRERAGVVLAGTVLVRVRFDATGATTHVHFGGALRDPPMEACIAERAREWRVPPLSGGDCATIELPFRIAPHAIDAGAGR